MKKILFLFLLALYSINSLSQVTVNKVEQDGSRIILTEEFRIYDYKLTSCGFARLNCVIDSNGEENYFLGLTLNEGIMTFNKGRKLLLKFQDDSIMELENIEEIELTDNKLEQSLSHSFYLVYPEYPVTKEQIQNIINNEIVKIRIENNSEYFDRNIKKNKFSKGIKSAYEDIQEKKLTKKDIYEGF